MLKSSQLFLWAALLCVIGNLLASAQAPAPDISVAGSLSSRVVNKGELLPFTVTVRNKTDAKANPKGTAYAVTLLRLPDGYTLSDANQICVLPLPSSRKASCQSSQEFEASGHSLIAALVPGESIAVQGYFTALQAHPSSQLVAVVSWTADSGVSSAQAVALGENRVRDWYQSEWLADATKALGLPLTLAFLTALIAAGVNEVSKRKEARAAKRDREQTLRAETWKQMLPLSHTYAAKFYLPLSLAAERFSKSLDKRNELLSFYYLLYCGKRMTATRSEIGGFYFKDLRGEILAAQCWERQRLACLGDEDSPFYASVLASVQKLEDIDTYESFAKTFVDKSGSTLSFGDDEIAEAWTHYQNWMKEKDRVDQVVVYLDGFTAVLDFESNRPYEYWYDNKMPAQLVASEKTEKELRKILESEKRYTGAEIDEYFTAVVRPR